MAKEKDTTEEIINPYDDIESFDQFDPDRNADLFGEERATDMRELQVGFGSDVFRADEQGIWLGAARFADAPFSVDMEGNVIAGALTITGGTITGATIQTSATGKRLIMAGSPANEYQFYEDATKVGHLKIDDDGAGGFFAELFIDHLGAALQVGSTVGAAEVVYFSTVGFESSIRAAVGSVQLTSKDGYTFGFEWFGGGDPLIVTNALPTSDPAVSGALWNDGGYVAVSP